MQERKNDQFQRWSFLIIGIVLLIWALFNLSVAGSVLNTVFQILFPFILGSFIALVIAIPSKSFEKVFLRSRKLQKKRSFVRVLSILISLIVILLVIALIILLVVPQIIHVGMMLVDNIPYYQTHLNELIEWLQSSGQFDLSGIQSNMNLEQIQNTLMDWSLDFFTTSLQSAYGAVGVIADVFIALVFSFYLITGKDNLKKQSKKFAHTFFPKRAETIIRIGKLGVTQFQNFVAAQCLEAVILGILCTLGLFLLQIPYAVTIGILVGVTALIPVVGAFIGIAVGAVLIVAVSPTKALIFIAFLLILQQVEGNLIYPKVVGNKVGLPGMWVLVAIMIGGGLFGMAGMLLGVPVGSVIYILVNERMNRDGKNTVIEGEKAKEDVKSQ